jgi:hypothetical protein
MCNWMQDSSAVCIYLQQTPQTMDQNPDLTKVIINSHENYCLRTSSDSLSIGIILNVSPTAMPSNRLMLHLTHRINKGLHATRVQAVIFHEVLYADSDWLPLLYVSYRKIEPLG